jgi:hypothetical protein
MNDIQQIEAMGEEGAEVCWFESVNVYSIPNMPACDIWGTVDNVHITAFGWSSHMVLTLIPLLL